MKDSFQPHPLQIREELFLRCLAYILPLFGLLAAIIRIIRITIVVVTVIFHILILIHIFPIIFAILSTSSLLCLSNCRRFCITDTCWYDRETFRWANNTPQACYLSSKPGLKTSTFSGRVLSVDYSTGLRTLSILTWSCSRRNIPIFACSQASLAMFRGGGRGGADPVK